MFPRFVKTDTNIAANAEPRVEIEDFAEPVRVNQRKLTSELKPDYDFIVCGSRRESEALTKTRLERVSQGAGYPYPRNFFFFYAPAE
jgi:hypothetical protein